MTFWTTATQEQKLAQIDGALELGVNSNQLAMNCGTTPAAVRQFARNHGRSFASVQGLHNWGASGARRQSERVSVEATKRISARTGTLGDAAFSIFDHQPEAFELEWPA